MMKVILLDDVANLGHLSDIVMVKSGYARNYLLPRRKVRRATAENIAEFQLIHENLAALKREQSVAAAALAKQLEGLTLQIVQKVGVDGRLFGSVTQHDIVAELSKQGITILRSAVRMPQLPIKIIGEHVVTIVLYQGLSVSLKISVLGEN